MELIYFSINGSSCPFWKEEKVDNKGNIYYWDMFWPESLSDNLKNEWNRILTLCFNYNNPIDIGIPSFWNKSMCDLFNTMTYEFLQKSLVELDNYKVIDRFIPIKENERLKEYRLDPIKYHLNFNASFDDKEEFKKYLDSKPELLSCYVIDILFYKNLIISDREFKAFNRVFLNFGEYKHFPISLCPFTNRTFLTDINIGGHGSVYMATRVDREDILRNEKKLIELINNY